ncbi:hypothetical protein BBO99_00000956 [Phytophthora kernoviae]|uniref:UBX domain-containing protein n=2 Tax=Phytophthora kernoviae TaxID=325452 RepID=A0A3R7JBS9_9STRA|nr:hypothetical protein G195_008084 [Phytophthora kernoviae 00238/432]KAG2531679.1 hypothetical protein JM16_000714 [Phytophthora kernoviae]KAG2532980.1 hypothetical protein JM18_000796 [Phytophthora kernoviae]RLN37747.1 hypothetical protein BBI17_000858 [Phytophthora kernoviae]RLN84903.1 hypothetical protein BBO99_00000956 [Phytophthora kernoviae]
MSLNVEFDHQTKRVKVTPGTTMFEVLETARVQFRLDESRQYQLLHRSKPIDLSIPFRLTGISNNASVELKGLEGGSEVQQVRVCIQLRDGKRVQASFGSDASIEHILNFFKLLPSSEAFSLGFLRREIGFTDFATMTLKELGIVSGSAMFRVQASDKQPPPPLPTVSYRENTPASSQKPHVSFVSVSPPPLPSVAETTETLNHTSVCEVEDEEMKEVDDEGMISTLEEENTNDDPIKSSYDALQLLRDNSFDAVSRTAIVTLMKIITNVLSNPENEKMRSIRLSNAAFQRSVGQVKGGLEFLRAKNFRTQAMRELDELKRKKVFQTALIRVQFPDRAVVQATFHPNETIRDVMDHVAECMDSLYKGNKFYLYVTPPTQKLAEGKTLAELNLVPAALTYLSWLEAPPQIETNTAGFYFRGDLLTDSRAESKESSDPLKNVEYPKPLHLGKLC